MTNYNARLDYILGEFVDGCDCRIDEGQAYLHQSEFAADEAKQAITSLIKELVAEAKPARAVTSDDEMGIDRARKSAANYAIDQFEHNLLKELEEV